MVRDVLSPKQAAKICRTSFMSVNRWIYSGKLKSYKTPGGHKKIKQDDLIEFMKKNSIPFYDEIIRKRYKVMIIDDDPDVCNLIAQEFRSSKYNLDVTTALDGFEAGALVSRILPDVVLLDLMMPGINGFKICRFIKESPQTRHIRVIVITGYGNDDNVEKAVAAGADRVLFKPVKIDKILKEIVV